MNDDIAIILTDLIKQYGMPLCADRQRLRNLLNDLKPGCRLEVNLLVQAVDQQIPNEVMALAQSLDDLTATRLANKIKNACGTSSTNSQWAVRVWAKALGKVATSPLSTNGSDPAGVNGRTPLAKPINTNGVSSHLRAKPYLEYVKAGDQFASEQDWESAVEAYKEALRINPQIIEIYDAEYYQACFECGLYHLKSALASLAVNDFSEAIRVNGKAVDAYFHRGNAYLAQEQFDAAIADYTKAMSLNLRTADVYLNRGYAYSRKGNLTVSLTDFDEAIRLNSGCGEAYVYRGLIYEFQGKHAEALKDYNEALRLSPDDPRTLYHRGLIRNAKGSCKTAVTDFAHAIRLKPDFAEAYLQRAIAFVSLGDYAKALDDLNKVIELAPYQSEAYYRRAVIYVQQGEWDKVVDDCSVALDCSAEEPEIVWLIRGEAYQALGDLNAALLDYSEAIKLKPDYALAYVRRGQVRQIKNLMDKAIEDYNRALTLDETCFEALMNRAEAYQALRRWNEAVQDYSAIIRLRPAYADAYLERARLLLSLNPNVNRDTAINDLVIFAELVPEARSNIDDTLANLLYQRATEHLAASRYEEAIRDYDTLSHVLPEREQECQSLTARVYVIRGETALKNGNYDKALADYEKADQLVASFCGPTRLIQVYLARGDTSLKQGYHQLALADYEKANQIMPGACKPAKVAQAYVACGEAAFKKSDYRAALDFYEKASRMEPSACPPAQLAQICLAGAEAALKGKAYDNAIQYCHAYLGYAPEPSDTVFECLVQAHKALAAQKLQEKDYQSVIEHCNNLLQLDCSEVEVYRHRSLALLELGELDAAAVDIEVATSMAPDDSHLLYARAELKRRRGDLDGAVADYELAIKSNSQLSTPILGSVRDDYYWTKALKLYKQEEPWEGEVMGWNNGGIKVGFGSLQIFVPNSQLEGSLYLYVNEGEKKITVGLIEVDRDANRLIGSKRDKVLQKSRLRKLQTGSIFEGQVVRLEVYGAFVKFNEFTGLVHKSEIVRGMKSVDPYRHLSIGQTVRVKVIDIKRDEGKVSLSISQAEQS